MTLIGHPDKFSADRHFSASVSKTTSVTLVELRLTAPSYRGFGQKQLLPYTLSFCRSKKIISRFVIIGSVRSRKDLYAATNRGHLPEFRPKQSLHTKPLSVLPTISRVVLVGQVLAATSRAPTGDLTQAIATP